MAAKRDVHRARVLLSAVGVLIAAAPGRAAGSLTIAETRLHTPPDSHEPQRALIALRNAGADAVPQTAILCTFTAAGGAVLDTQAASVPEIAGHAAARAEAIYYGWPRAGSVSCRLAAPR